MNPKDLNPEGLSVRREVLGDKYVDRALESAGEFEEDVQKFVTEYCWGAVWGRPGLDRRTRSLINIGMICVLGRMDELRTHVRGALNNGCTVGEIKEVLLQVSAYAGFPASLDGFRVAKGVIQEGQHD